MHRRADQVGQRRRGHRAGRAGVEVGHQRDRLLAVERALDGVAARRDQRAELGGGLRRLDLEEPHLLDLARHARQERHRQRHARDRRVLHHDRDAAGLADPGEMLEGRLLVGAQQRAVVGRHHHHHRGAHRRRLAGAGLDDRGREVRDRDDDRHRARPRARGRAGSGPCAPRRRAGTARRSWRGCRCRRPLVDHAVDDPLHAVEVERAVVGEGRRRNRPDAGERSCHAAVIP